MTRVGIEQAKTHLAELLDRAAGGESILITNGDKPLGMLTAPPAEESFPAVGTPEWDRMNQRRAELIRKKNRGGLSAEEAAEWEQLQRRSRSALEDQFPASTRWDEDLARLEERLGEPQSPKPE